LETPYADLNGDSVLDLVLPVQVEASKARLEMRAFSGKDGAKLWQAPVLPDDDLQELFGNMPPAAAGDLDGDGKPEACLLSFGAAVEDQGSGMFVQIEVIEGATGKSQWTTRFPVDVWSSRLQGSADRVTNRLRPLLIRRPDGKQWVALLHWANAYQVHVLDERGNVLSKLAGTPHNPGNGARLWPVDANGDGGEELLLLSEDALKLLPPDRLDQPLWQRNKSTSPTIDGIVGILTPEAAIGKIVVLGGRGKDLSLFGLDPISGQTVWQCLGPCIPVSPPANEMVRLLSIPTLETPAQALFRFTHTAFARAGVPTASDSEAWQAAVRTDATTSYDGVDPRLLRTLPWKPSDHEIQRMPRSLAWAFFYGLTMVALPVGYVVYVVRRRQWGLKTLLSLPVVAGVFLFGAALPGPGMESEFRTVLGKLSVAVFPAAPWLFAVFAVTHWARQRNYRALLGWLIAALALLALIVVATLIGVFPPNSTPLRPDERWSWEGWYYVLLPVGQAIVSFMLLLVPAWWAFLFVRNHWKTRRTPPALKMS
jgi:hypothetical protein